MPIDGHDLANLSPSLKATLPIELRLDDVNVAGHVGNASLVRVIDEARNRFLGYSAAGRSGGGGGVLEGLGKSVRNVIAQQTIEYRTEVWYSHHPVVATMWISHIGTSSFALATAIYTNDAEPAVLSEATYVLLADPDGRPWPMDRTIKDRLSLYAGQPPQLRQRPSAATHTAVS